LKRLIRTQRNCAGGSGSTYRIEKLYSEHIPAQHPIDRCHQIHHAPPGGEAFANKQIDLCLSCFVTTPAEQLLMSEEVVSPRVAAKKVLTIEDEYTCANHHPHEQREQE